MFHNFTDELNSADIFARQVNALPAGLLSIASDFTIYREIDQRGQCHASSCWLGNIESMYFDDWQFSGCDVCQLVAQLTEIDDILNVRGNSPA